MTTHVTTPVTTHLITHVIPHLLILLFSTLLSECTSGTHLVYPTIISSENGGNSLKIGLTIESSQIVLLLEKNRAVVRTYKVYTQDDKGNLIPSKLDPPCQYHGSVLGYSSSLAVISTCDGIRGNLQYGKEEYYIRPVSDSSKLGEKTRRVVSSKLGKEKGRGELGEDKLLTLHELYPPPIYNNNYTAVGIGQEGDNTQLPKIRAKRITSYRKNNKEIMAINVKKLERRFIELSVIIDKKQHQVLGNNVKQTTDFAESVVNSIASKYKPFNIIVGMVQFIIWKTQNVVTIPNNYTRVLDATANYRRDVLLKQQWSDVTIMISGVPFYEQSTIGGAYTGGMCDVSRSTNVNYDKQGGANTPYLATLITHEIGHVMGMFHDDDDINANEHGACDCPCRAADFQHTSNYVVPDFCGDEEKCIMWPVLNRNYEYFSGCSRRVLEEGITKHRCLFNAPEDMHSDSPVCGNAIIEEGETCDCGSEEDCPILDPCCEVGTCQLKNTSSCFTGACCTEQCQFVDKGTVCREKTPGLECDFEESCTGTHSACPVDTYKQNARTCKDESNKVGYCSSSDCRTLQSQCKYLFGYKARAGGDECFNNNLDGNWLGNCGKDSDGNYIVCKEKNMKCGLLHCQIPANYLDDATNHAYAILGSERVTVGKSKDLPGGVNICVVSRFVPPNDQKRFDDEGEGFNDYGQVFDYTPCGDDGGMFCMSAECTFEAPTPCPAYNGTECGGHGMCNNLNQCHCDKDWTSDICVDFHQADEETIDYKTIIIILIIAVVLVPLVVGVIVYVVKHKFDLKTMAHPRTISRNIRRFSSRAFSRQGSSNTTQEKVKNSPFVTQYTRVPKVGDNPAPAAKAVKKGAGMKIPPAPTAAKPDKKKGSEAKVSSAPATTEKNALRVPPPPPSKPSWKVSPSSTPSSSTTKINGHPPASQTGVASLRNARDGLRPARLDARTHSETFKNVSVPLNTLSSNNKPVSDSNISKKPALQPPKLLAGRSRESKKLQISGPTNGNLYGLDGRPKSVHSTDIKQSSDSINTVSSTRALFEPQKKVKSRWS